MKPGRGIAGVTVAMICAAGCAATTDAAGEQQVGAQSELTAVHTLSTLGDSITQAANADDAQALDLAHLIANPSSVFHDNPELSWVQGTDPRVGSVRMHYASIDPGLVMKPFSRSGAELVGRNSSVPNLEKQARSIGSTQPDLLYVLLGGNDVCNRAPSTTDDPTANMYSLDEWKAAVTRGLTALAEVMPAGSTARFVSMPRVDLLFEQAGPAAITVLYEGSPLEDVTTCGALWSLFASFDRPICPIVTGETSVERRRAIGVRIDQYNDVLAAEVRRFDADASVNPRGVRFQSDWHGGLGAGGVMNGSGGTFVYEAAHVGKLDCFHPSIAGQKALADLVLHRAQFTGASSPAK